MKHLILIAVMLLAACSTGDRYNAIASTCQAYAVALKTAARLNGEGKLSSLAQHRINQTIEPARKVCSGDTPTDDPEAVNKIKLAVIAVLEAQK